MPMPLASLVSAAVVNFQTPDLIETAVRSFHEQYPSVRLLVVDNGSTDASRDVIRSVAADLGEAIQPLLLDHNRFHGPAMHLAIESLTTRFAYVFDSDTKTERGGFLEAMVDACAGETIYGAGKVVRANRRGFASPRGIPVLASAFMLLKRDLYLSLPPFIHHGLPALRNFQAAAERGYELAAFPIEDYVTHYGRGTAERFGYGLGVRSRIDYVLNKLGL
jgi:glycosyltransferase involved in cell wall biosynthesis